MPERRSDVADQQGEQPGHADRQNDRRHDVHGQQLERPHRHIGADADEGGVSEGQVAGQAEQDVEADREDAEDRELLQQVGIGRAHRLQSRIQGRIRTMRKADQQEPVVAGK
jgi:hypothetical protein